VNDEAIGTLFIEITGEEVGIVGSHPLHHIAHRALTRRKPFADLGDKHLKALIAKTARGILL
jgi:hypothetical protein